MNTKFKKADVLLIIAAVLIVGLAVCVYIFLVLGSKEGRQSIALSPKPSIEQRVAIANWVCLKDDEEAGFYGGNGFMQSGEIFTNPLEVIVREKDSQEVRRKIVIDNIDTNRYAIQIYKCGIYVLRRLNYDSKKSI